MKENIRCKSDAFHTIYWTRKKWNTRKKTTSTSISVSTLKNHLYICVLKKSGREKTKTKLSTFKKTYENEKCLKWEIRKKNRIMFCCVEMWRAIMIQKSWIPFNINQSKKNLENKEKWMRWFQVNR